MKKDWFARFEKVLVSTLFLSAFLSAVDVVAEEKKLGDQAASGSLSLNSDQTIATVNGFSDFDLKAKPYAYVMSSAIWQWPENAPKVIYVCWENLAQSAEIDRNLVVQAVQDSWQSSSRLRFEGWGQCASGNYGIHILVEDSGPHTKGLGKQLDRVKDGMVLNFTFDNWNKSCGGNDQWRKSCIKSIAVHEFGHALGFAHEQNRFDAPGECGKLAQGSNGDLLLTPYDPKSVMNYCNRTYNNDGKLSEYDRLAVVAVYGAP